MPSVFISYRRADEPGWSALIYERLKARFEAVPDGHYLNKAAAVGLYPHATSPFGIDDMVGNVWEFCYATDSQVKSPT